MARAVAGLSGSPEATRVALCREFGWTFWDYMEQPQDFVDECTAYLVEQSKEEQRRNRAASRSTRKH